MNAPKSLRIWELTKTIFRLLDESVEQLRERLNTMKKLMSEKQAMQAASKEWKQGQQNGVIDGNFLSFAFGGALLVIVTVSIYAFYNLYHAILKKFPSQHTEL